MKRLSMIGCSLVLASCAAVGPDYKKPEVDILDSWKETTDNAIDTSAGDTSLWWENFNDPTLSLLIETAHKQNLTLQIAGLRVHESRAVLGIATGSRYPQSTGLNASAATLNISENGDPITNLPPGVSNLLENDYERFGVGLDAAWELDVWGRFRRGVEFADAGLAASIATYDDALVSITSHVASTYALLRTLEERLNYAENNVALQARSLEIAEVRFNNGLVTELDVQLAKSLLGNTQSTIPGLKAGIRKTKLALALLMGMPPNDLKDMLADSGSIPSTDKHVAIGIPADLLRRRPDIRRNELVAVAQSARIGLAEAELYPAFRLAGSVGFAADSTGDVFDSGSDFGLGLFSVDWKFLSYGRIRNKVRMEDARFQQSITAYQNSVLDAAREVESNLTGFVRAKERVEALSRSVKAARRAVELAQTQYRDGVISYTLVLDAQQFQLLNEDQLTAARGEVARNLIATYKSLGGGWELRNTQTLINNDTREQMRERTNWGGLLDPESVVPVSANERGSWRAPDF